LNSFTDVLRTLADAVGSRSGGASALRYPLTPEPRIAVFDINVSSRRGQFFPRGWTAEQVNAFQPEALAGSLPGLREAANLIESGKLKLPLLTFPVVVFTKPEGGRLSSDELDELWSRLRLPVFEQIRSASGQLLAYECEARDGFHVLDDFQPDGIWRVSHERCGCGLSSMRMFPSAALSRVR
jgi:hypothetical protein